MYRQRYPDDPGMHNTGNAYTHVESTPSFCEKIQSSLVTTIIGLVLVGVAIVLLSFNEGRAVATSKSLDEGLASCTELKSSHAVEPQLNGRLIHLSDKISCDGILSDPALGVAVSAVSLKRTVEMYQWVETEHRDERELPNGDKEVTRSYTYDMYWKSDLVRSSSFDSSHLHVNPTSMPFDSDTYTAPRVTLGAFTLSNNLVRGINTYTDLRPSVVPDNRQDLQIVDKYFYRSNNPDSPQVGDVRVSFSYAGLCKDSRLGPPQTVSVMAMQKGFTLTGYQTLAGDVLEMITLSHKSALDMIQKAHSDNVLFTWLFRGLGLFLMFIAFTCLSSFVRTLVCNVPILRELVTLTVTAFNISLSVSLSLLTIAVSWVYYRPAMALAILALSAAFILLPRYRSQRVSRQYYT